ncbi:hypothetical protein [Paenibacillus sp. FSL E2-0178]|uniref:hypothetical protein n=1 Tax=Paenibacillus sp. FSL E2-0178 TaxID=2921361 RepID=UPI0031593C4B
MKLAEDEEHIKHGSVPWRLCAVLFLWSSVQIKTQIKSENVKWKCKVQMKIANKKRKKAALPLLKGTAGPLVSIRYAA